MTEQQPVDVIIYRVRDNGLEVFLVNPEQAEGLLQAPDTGVDADASRLLNYIELDPVTNADGVSRKALAVEADWHELPSLRALMYEDYRVAKEKAKLHIKNLLPELDKGAFFAVKDALKRIMPEQYAYLKELKDIVSDKNQTKYI
jgi:hypothetical protein